MTDEATGGKPRPFDKMRAGPLEALEYAKTDPMTHVTIPTAALTELIEAAEECAEDSVVYRVTVADRLGTNPERIHVDDGRFIPSRLRAAVARVRGE